MDEVEIWLDTEVQMDETLETLILAEEGITVTHVIQGTEEVILEILEATQETLGIVILATGIQEVMTPVA